MHAPMKFVEKGLAVTDRNGRCFMKVRRNARRPDEPALSEHERVEGLGLMRAGHANPQIIVFP